jgi:tripartite-type tricarboxylate transporter receptor subunit TctC
LKADAGSLSIGIQPASADLVNMMLFADANGIDRNGLRLVTYDGGGPTRNATAGAVVDIGMVGGQGFIPLAEKVRPLVVFDDAKRDGWDAPTVTELNGADAQFVAGSQRGWGVHASFVANHADRYQTLLAAIEATTKDPAVVASLKDQKLATDWFGPDVSNKALASTAKVMEQHIDLLKGT